MDCSLPGSSTHGIFQARILEWVFLTQGSNPGLPHRRQTLYPLSHQEGPGQQVILSKLKSDHISVYAKPLNTLSCLHVTRSELSPSSHCLSPSLSHLIFQSPFPMMLLPPQPPVGPQTHWKRTPTTGLWQLPCTMPGLLFLPPGISLQGSLPHPFQFSIQLILLITSGGAGKDAQVRHRSKPETFTMVEKP